MQKQLIIIGLIVSLLSVTMPGCTKHNDASSPAPSDVFIVTQTGGNFLSKDARVSMTFPVGSVDSKSNLSLEPAANPPATAAYVAETAYSFGPDGTLFRKPVRLSIKYDPAKIPSDVLETSLCLGTLIDGSWYRLFNSQVDTVNKTVAGFIESFSTYGLVGSDMTITIDPASPDCAPGAQVRLMPTVHNAPAGYKLWYKWTIQGTCGDLVFDDAISPDTGLLDLSRSNTSGFSWLKDGSVTYKSKDSTPDGSSEKVELSVITRFSDADNIVTDYEWVKATFKIDVVKKDLRYWYLSGSENPLDDIRMPGDMSMSHGGVYLKVNGKGVPGVSTGESITFYARPGDSLEVRLVGLAEPGDRPYIGALWLHQWDGAKSVVLKEENFTSIPPWTQAERTVADHYNPENLDVYWAETYAIPSLKIDPLELGYDRGVSDGGLSLGGRAQYGFQVRYTSDKFFKVNKIKIFSWIKSAPKETDQFTLWLGDLWPGYDRVDPLGNTIWTVTLPASLFTAEKSWLEVPVPNLVTNKELFVRLYAPSIGAGTGPYVGIDQSSSNSHSSMISKYQKDVETGYRFQPVEWALTDPLEAKTNFMIRVEGNAVNPMGGGSGNQEMIIIPSPALEVAVTGMWDEDGKPAVTLFDPKTKPIIHDTRVIPFPPEVELEGKVQPELVAFHLSRSLPEETVFNASAIDQVGNTVFKPKLVTFPKNTQDVTLIWDSADITTPGKIGKTDHLTWTFENSKARTTQVVEKTLYFILKRPISYDIQVRQDLSALVPVPPRIEIMDIATTLCKGIGDDDNAVRTALESGLWSMYHAPNKTYNVLKYPHYEPLDGSFNLTAFLADMSADCADMSTMHLLTAYALGVLVYQTRIVSLEESQPAGTETKKRYLTVKGFCWVSGELTPGEDMNRPTSYENGWHQVTYYGDQVFDPLVKYKIGSRYRFAAGVSKATYQSWFVEKTDWDSILYAKLSWVH